MQEILGSCAVTKKMVIKNRSAFTKILKKVLNSVTERYRHFCNLLTLLERNDVIVLKQDDKTG